jgi:hypothetical protein
MRTPLRTFFNSFPIILTGFFTLPCIAQAQEWVQVHGGPFKVPPAVLSVVKKTLRDHVASKRKSRGDWGAFLIQYRSVYFHGHRALEIHGSCQFDKLTFNVHSGFYDEMVSDGGGCYFLIFYDLEFNRYTNVVFHGLA